MPVDEANIGNPVTLPARKTRFDILAFEADGCSTKPRCIDIFEHVDVDDRIEMIRDLAGDQRHRAAPRADVKRRGPGPEGVLRHQRGITNSDRQPGIGVRSPDASVLRAKSATARARRNLWRVSFAFEIEGDIAAVAFTDDEHVDIGARRAWCIFPPIRPGIKRVVTGKHCLYSGRRTKCLSEYGGHLGAARAARDAVKRTPLQ